MASSPPPLTTSPPTDLLSDPQQQQQVHPYQHYPVAEEPETTVSLENQEEVVSDLEKSPTSTPHPSQHPEESVRADPTNDSSSSADDSSYFADPSHLPKPKSNRRYSSQRESDASLSFSSEDSVEQDHRNSNNIAIPRPRPGVPELYPQQLTRMHSVSSLVSTSSQHSSDSGGGAQQQPPHHQQLTPSQMAAWVLPSHSSKESELAYSGESNSELFPVRKEQSGSERAVATAATTTTTPAAPPNNGFRVYWQRWLMLWYMSLLNLLSDWTCYSVAPIAILTEEAFGRLNAEQLVVVFLGANALATACEPIILSRLGLRRTVLFGALLLMMGSIVKSGGMPPIIQANVIKGEGQWRVYLGFFLVGLSQPLYQCTPALLSASWFPEEERTMATGVALNANQVGIGFAFVFGTLLVSSSDDIPRYFGLLSLISTLVFLGTLLQFDDAPPTPPSDTARVMRGTLEVTLPSVQSIVESVRNIGSGRVTERKRTVKSGRSSRRSKSKRSGGSGGPPSSSSSRKRTGKHQHQQQQQQQAYGSFTPSSMVPGATPNPDGHDNNTNNNKNEEPQFPPAMMPYPPYYGMPPPPPPGGGGEQPDHYAPQHYQHHPMYHPPPPPPHYMYDPRHAQHAMMYGPPPPHQPPPQQYPPDPYYQYYSYQGVIPPPPHTRQYAPVDEYLPAAGAIDEGAEPVITITPHHVDIHIRDDQILLSTRACLARPGFVHSLVSFTVSGIVINTLSTFMDYLVRLNGAGREYTGIVGGTFQFMIMISSLIIGKVCDTTRAYYSIAIGMLVVGAFGLAECGVSLDADRGSDLRWSLIVVAILVGPLQPVSTELGVDVVYPLSENTVLVIQQLFSNLLSAAFIPCFKAMRDIGMVAVEDGATERPEYTFSFYMLIVLHAAATVFFATFNGRYLRYEHELEKKAKEERRRRKAQGNRAFQRLASPQDQPHHYRRNGERTSLIPTANL